MSLTDIETELVQYLNGLYAPPLEWSTRLPRDWEDRLPYGTLRRAPGGAHVDQDTQWLEAARLQVDTYDTTDVGAFEATTAGIDALNDAVGQPFGTLVLTSMRVSQTPQWLPDLDTNRPHYVTFLIAHAHPA